MTYARGYRETLDEEAKSICQGHHMTWHGFISLTNGLSSKLTLSVLVFGTDFRFNLDNLKGWCDTLPSAIACVCISTISAHSFL